MTKSQRLYRLCSLCFLLLACLLPLSAQNAHPSHALHLEGTLGNLIHLKGQKSEVQLIVTNMGSEHVREFTYVFEWQGKKGTEHTYTLSQPLTYVNEFLRLNFPLPLLPQSSMGELKLSITKVNGQPNAAAPEKAQTKGHLIVVSQSPRRRVVVEDFTGMWCGYCPIAMGALEVLAHDFSDKVIPLAVHYRDILARPEYGWVVQKYVSGFPHVRVNRYRASYTRLGYDYKNGEPYALLQDILEEEKATTEASVHITKAELQARDTRVNIETSTTFTTSGQDALYHLAYVLVADGLHGESYDWLQRNYYSGKEGVRNIIPQFVDAPGAISGLRFNHTVVRAESPLDGMPHSLPSTIEEGVSYRHHHAFDISNTRGSTGHNIIQDKSKLTAVVMLIDRRTGRIVNAHSAPVMPEAQAPPLRIALGSTGWATLGTSSPLTVPTGVQVSAIVGQEQGQLTTLPVATAGQHLPAGAGLLIKGQPNSIAIFAPAPEAAPTVAIPTTNLLHPATLPGRIRHTNDKLYILADDAEKGIGFYWQQGTQGDWVSGIAERAYLAIPSTQAHTQGYTFGQGLLTALPALPLAPAPQPALYDLSGRRLHQPSSPGLYIRAGKKVLQ